MKYDFNTGIDRRNTDCVKWDMNNIKFGTDDLLPLWVADMDFKAPPEVTEALVKRASHGAYGYTFYPESLYEAVIDWEFNRHGWEIRKEWINFTSGIVPAINFFVDCFTVKGDGIVIQTPVYPPFLESCENNERKLLENRLVESGNSYEIDFDDLEIKLKEAKMMIISSPHNPVGKLFTKEELRRTAELCLRHNVILISDEIHQDIFYPGTKHTCTASLSNEISQNTITCIAPSKTFNLPGLQLSAIIIKNDNLRNRFFNYIKAKGLEYLNLFGILAGETAYRYGAPWLNELLKYLEANRDFAADYIRKNIPGIKPVIPQATYLMWLDFRSLNLPHKELEDVLKYKAKVGLYSGGYFGSGGEGFMRLNFACPRSTLEEGLKRILSGICS